MTAAARWFGDGRHWRWVGAAIALCVVCAVKEYYRVASPASLAWILAPTAKLVSLVAGTRFEYEAGAGWISRDSAFIITPACAGLNFALATFLAVTVGWWRQLNGARATAHRLMIAAGLAFAATAVVNTVRIAIALALRLDGDVHRAEGIAVYLIGLCAVCALARKLGGQESAGAAAA